MRIEWWLTETEKRRLGGHGEFDHKVLSYSQIRVRNLGVLLHRRVAIDKK
jgi:hypothetical protein